MEYQEAKDIIEEMRTRYDGGFSSHDKSVIEKMYWEVLAKEFRKTNCSSCYKDAYIEIYLYLKNHSKMKDRSNYRLLNGIIIQDFEKSEIYNNDNLTDEAAENYLKKFPKRIDMFQSFPEDWKKRVEGGEKATGDDEIIDHEKKAAESEANKGTEVVGELHIEGTETKEEDRKKESMEVEKAKDVLFEEMIDRLKSGSTVKQLKDDYENYSVGGSKLQEDELDCMLEDAQKEIDDSGKKG